ncbi:amidase signature enzyme [Venturia nashicola]|uniref:Amidase signature enzyme n=1 Tax=Venturia nashicola TaxID=86259 RepID=A0A4Z1P6M4_9PEZI|nr:amidase signature enzyme [Venturia nashicola]TLD31827.1 amidase signature enzyme [Venturia nashicola]
MYLSAYLTVLTLLPSISAQTTPFDAREATIVSCHHALFTGLNTCQDIVSAFLSRIEALNPKINAIISLNPKALAQAQILDQQLSIGNASEPLFCVPILLKDNYDTVDMRTTGGNLALQNSQPTIDAPVVTALRDAGAILLGKANLHELALEGISVSSLGGQTINPYDSSRTPGGSSGGSAAAVAASFAVLATGTDTVNSLRSPASANSLFSIRPTRGLISRTGVIPISYTQDALGAIGRTVRDVATALTVMAGVGFDPVDNTTAFIPASSMNLDYSADLDSVDLQNVRLGLVTTFFNRNATNETTPVNNAMDAYISRLRAAGAKIIPINESIYTSTTILTRYDTQRYEYRESMDTYLSRPSLKGSHPPTLSQIYTTNSSNLGGGPFLVLPSQYEYVTTSLTSSTSNITYTTVQTGISNLTLSLAETFKHNSLDALIYPEQTNLVVPLGSPSQSGRNGILAAVSGSPVVTIPIGFSNATKTAPVGVPIGMEILGRPWSETKLLGIGRAMEKLGRVRKIPKWAEEIVEGKIFDEVPVVVPDRENIPSAYPVGVL